MTFVESAQKLVDFAEVSLYSMYMYVTSDLLTKRILKFPLGNGSGLSQLLLEHPLFLPTRMLWHLCLRLQPSLC